MQQKRFEMITLLRGQVACPLLANLAEFGWLEQMSAGSFSIANFPQAKPPVVKAIFQYLASVGLIIEQCEIPDHYTVSEFGRSVFARIGAFCILNSYEDFFQDLRLLLFDGHAQPKPLVNRLRNVYGSGHLHSRKFFKPALQMLTGRSFPFLVDLGCGNGQFLQLAAEAHLASKLGGVDVSNVAMIATNATLNRTKSDVHLHTVEADVSSIPLWRDQLPWFGEAGLFSLWFVLHEFSQRDPQVILQFLRNVNHYYPSAELIVGELVKLPEHVLADNRAASIMPEFLFFHALSGQGVLSWTDWQEIRRAMPFDVVGEHYLDNIVSVGGTALPSSFIWHLKPI